ncbi:MAG: WG repeat-containing protein [Muribaculaceae bacterium]|nr:WG repeat-containing protein [Muribaculaceae bacterium]
MSFEDDMIENGFSDANDYMDYLMDEDERRMQREEESDRRAEEYEAWLENLSDEERDDLLEEKELQERRRNEELQNARKKRFNEERILKLWAKDNPQKALRWFAHYRQSPDVRKKDLDDFLSKLGTLSFGSNYSIDHWWGGYYEWKHWLEKDEAYQEFKKKTPPEDYQRFKIETYREYIDIAFLRLIDYCYTVHPDNKNEGFYYSGGKKTGKLNASNTILKKWINDHSELWKQIALKYNSALKTNEEYLFQAWLETVCWRDAFTVWKITNPSIWQRFKIECVEGKVLRIKDLWSIWSDINLEQWKNWKLEHIEKWNSDYEFHRKYLWCVYTEIKWKEFLDSKNIIEDLNEDDEDDIDFDDCVEDDNHAYKIKYRKYKYGRYKYDDLAYNDPRYSFKCRTNEEEDSIHNIIIEQYDLELKDNPEKRLFIDNNCSETEFDAFVGRKKKISYGFPSSYGEIEESPEEYALRKILELWPVEYSDWIYRYCWNKKYNDRYTEYEYYKVWIQLNATKWEKWINTNMESWKQNAQNLDLLLAWLFDNNEWTFHEWASENISTWMRILDYVMESAFDSAFHSLFTCSASKENSFNEWRKNNFENWKYWKETFREQILEDRFIRGNISIDYDPEYRLYVQFQEKIYMQKIGMKVFYENLAVIEDDDMYGYINEVGAIVLDPQYDDALPFQNGIAAVKTGALTYEEYDPALGYYIDLKTGGKWGFINTNGEYILEPQFDDIAFIHGDNFVFGCYFYPNDDYIKNDSILFSKGGSVEIIDDRPQIINSKWGIMDKNLCEIIPSKYDVIRLLNHNFFKAGRCDGDSYKWALLSKSGEELTAFIYSDIYNDKEENCFLANKIAKNRDCEDGSSYFSIREWGYLNMDGDEIEPFIDAYNELDFIVKWDEMHR